MLETADSTLENPGFEWIKKSVLDQNRKHINILVSVVFANFDENLMCFRANLETFWVRQTHSMEFLIFLKLLWAIYCQISSSKARLSLEMPCWNRVLFSFDENAFLLFLFLKCTQLQKEIHKV